jgi:hypothetical protein
MIHGCGVAEPVVWAAFGTVGAARLLVAAGCSEFSSWTMAEAIEEDGSGLEPLGGRESSPLVPPLLSATGLEAIDDVEARACESESISCCPVVAEGSAEGMVIQKRTRSRGAQGVGYGYAYRLLKESRAPIEHQRY